MSDTIGGWFSLTALVAIVAALPGSSDDVALRTGMPRPRVHKALRQLNGLRIVHKSGYEHRGVRKSCAIVWGPGDKPDATLLTLDGLERRDLQHTPRRPSAQVIAFASMVRALDDPQTARSLCAATGMSKRSVYAFLKAMAAADLVHVAGWDRSGWQWVPEYLIGKGRSMPKPAAQTRQQILARSAAAVAGRKRQRLIQDALARPPVRRAETATECVL